VGGKGLGHVFRFLLPAHEFGNLHIHLRLAPARCLVDACQELFGAMGPPGGTYRYATFYSYDEVVNLMVQAGFVTENIISTLFQKPENVQYVEEPKEGYFHDAGFTIIAAGKK